MLPKYCQFCAGDLIQKGTRYFSCVKCRRNIFLNVQVTSAAVLENEKGQILLTQRKNQLKNGLWGLPGGFLEFNESAESALKREVREEIGLDLENVQYLGSFPDEYKLQEVTYHYVTLVFSSIIHSSRLKLQDEEIQAAKWFSPKEIPIELLAFESIKEIISAYQKVKPV